MLEKINSIEYENMLSSMYHLHVRLWRDGENEGKVYSKAYFIDLVTNIILGKK